MSLGHIIDQAITSCMMNGSSHPFIKHIWTRSVMVMMTIFLTHPSSLLTIPTFTVFMMKMMMTMTTNCLVTPSLLTMGVKLQYHTKCHKGQISAFWFINNEILFINEVYRRSSLTYEIRQIHNEAVCGVQGSLEAVNDFIETHLMHIFNEFDNGDYQVHFWSTILT